MVGVIEVVANVKETRQAFVQYFAESLLGIELGSDRLPLRRYDLTALSRPYYFPTDPQDGVESVRVKLEDTPVDAEEANFSESLLDRQQAFVTRKKTSSSC